MHDNKFNNIKSYIRAPDGSEIMSAESLKILGFHFNSRPNANHHVSIVIEKFFARLWTLRFLKRSGMDSENLLFVFKSIIRPMVEYSSVIYGPLIPKYMSDQLESAQRQAMKIIYGNGMDMDSLISSGKIELLEDRRKSSSLRFALKTLGNARFAGRWFPKSKVLRQARPTTRRVYEERKCKTERARNNPIQYMIRQLNEHEIAEEESSNRAA